jgi:hypothetical protein
MALAGAGPATASTFKSVDHNWTVALNQATLHAVAPGGVFTTCPGQDFSAITPDITYAGAAVGETYSEEVIGPKAAGTIHISVLRNVDGDMTPLRFTKASGAWANTYAVLSFPGSVGHSTLPDGKYTFAVLVKGKVVASTSLKLAHRRAC